MTCMVREAEVVYGKKEIEVPDRIHSDNEVAQILRDYGIADKTQENFVAICLDAQHRPVAIHTVAIGTASSVTVHPRDVFRVAVMSGASAVILGHNHPSGSILESADDRALTQRMVDAGKLLGIPVLDHVIVTPNGDHVTLIP